jgi:hypothetical protein
MRTLRRRGQTFFDYIIVIAIVLLVTFLIVNRFKDSIESILTQSQSAGQSLQSY